MTRPRKHIVCLNETACYHVTARCVRRAFLCGIDHDSGQNHEHRRDWIEQRLRVLSSLFCVDIAAYAIMSNHYHLVIRLTPEEADTWSDKDVLQRWCSLFKGPVLARRYIDGEALSEAEGTTVLDIAAVYRERLKSLSWFMKCLNERIARMANAEDQCTGHFWEARFHSVPLRTDAAVIQAMAYVDLNPIRAQTAKTPEASDHTSFKARAAKDTQRSQVKAAIQALYERGELLYTDIAIKPLMAFADQPASHPSQRLPIGADDYGMLVDALARCAVPEKQGRITGDLPSLIERMGLSSADWAKSASTLKRG